MIGLDSDCIIDFLRGRPEAVSIISRYKDEIVTTEVNVFEVFFGIYIKETVSHREEESARLFFNSVEILGGTGWGIRAAQRLSTLIKQGKEIQQNDCLIASLFITNGCTSIITRNSAHFSRLDIKTIGY